MGARSSKITAQNNRSDGHLLEYFRNTFLRGGGGTNFVAPLQGLTATGGVISDYTDGPAVYRAHIFTSSGTFTVTAPGTFGDTVEYLVVGGGGGGGAGFHGYGPGAGGGGGGWVQVTSYPISTTPGSYPISVGAGGVGGGSGTPNVGGGGRGTDGTSSTFTNPSPQVITAAGGGGAAGSTPPSALVTGNPGGSGGGGGYAPTPPVSGGTGTQPGLNPGVSNITQYGFNGGTGDTSPAAGGGAGGGAGGTGTSYSSPASTERSGGSGRASVYAYGPTNPTTYAAGGPANGPQPTTATNAAQGTGDGGMASRQNIPGTNAYAGGSGGSGIVVVRYQIAQLTAVQKATGGAISYYSGKTIHTFTTSGTFVNPASISNVEIVMVAGGGAGGVNIGGGGGAGAVLEGSSITLPASTYTITVGSGGAGRQSLGPTTPGTASNTTISFPGPFTWTANRGGYGASYPDIAVQPGGSGGGGASDVPTGGSSTSTPSTTPLGTLTSYGFAGSPSSGNYQGAGGGGAGQAGQAPPTPAQGGNGGFGRRLPATFHDPVVAPGPGTGPQVGGGLGSPGPLGGYYIAGGGGGSSYPTSVPSGGAGGYGGGGGGATGSNNPPATDAQSGIQNTGSGGGGSGYSPTNPSISGNGGSGIVLIAYPS